MKKSKLFLMTLLGMLLVFAGSIWAETDNQYRNRNQNRNTIQNRRVKQNLNCQTVLSGDEGKVTGNVTQCTFDGLTLSVTGVEIGDAIVGDTLVLNGLGPERYWDEESIDKPEVGASITVTYRTVTFGNGDVRNILFSVTLGDTTIQLRSEAGCPLWRP